MSDSFYSIDFQRAVVKLMATNIQFATEFSNLVRNDYFEVRSTRTIFNIVKKFVLNYEKEIDLSSLNVEIDAMVESKGFDSEIEKEYKEEAKNIFKQSVSSEEYIKDKVLKFCKRQEFKNALAQSIEILEQDGKYDTAVSLIEKAVNIGVQKDLGMNYLDLQNIPTIYNKAYNSDLFIPSGFPTFDSGLMGGFGAGEVHLFIGPPKSGKSTLAANLGCNALVRDKKVFHVSLEIKEIDVMMKYACRLTGMTYKEITNLDNTQIYRDKLDRFMRFKNNLYVTHWPMNTANCLDIRSWISSIRAATGVSPDEIIIDYDDCLSPINGSKADMYNDAGEIYKDMIQLAEYFSCPVITMAQPGKYSWNKAEEGEAILGADVSHSAKKIHMCWSYSSLNFKRDSDIGFIYVNGARRGESYQKIMVKRDYTKALLEEYQDE